MRPSSGDDVAVARRLALAHDASHFLLVPAAVGVAASAEQMSALLAECTATGRRLTFRSGGTSLSGQAQTDSLLVDTRRHFRDATVLDDGRRLRTGPGLTLRAANARLAPYGFRLGPDPASESACTVGGVIANNSSGMTCGTTDNAYRTVESMRVVLASGTIIDTGSPDADDVLRARERALYDGLLSLRDRVRGNPESVREIERQFALKNTMGYSLNAFLDADRPAAILTRLMVGSEGTLGFVAEATFRTVGIRPHAATTFVVLDCLEAALDALPALAASGAAAIELLDARALRVAQRDAAWARSLPAVDVQDHAGLLVEYQEFTESALAEGVDRGRAMLQRLARPVRADFARAATTRADLWHGRKGLYAAVAGARPSGTTALLEDVAVPVGVLAAACADLTALFDRHGYEESVIFGHAKDGNIHFLLNERFDDPASLHRYRAFTEDLVDLVLAAGGTLKAEHGTGRVMAPFVERQYGSELYDVIRQVKRLFDPAGILNPGAVVSDDPTIHLRHLKTTPTVEAEVDTCVDCGYCEPVCPSRDLTLTPRQRIALRRERARAQAAGDGQTVAHLDAVTGYAVVDTCAVDGMCATACPLGIDTGALTKRLRAERGSAAVGRAWTVAARHWDATTVLAASALTAAARHPRLAEIADTAVGRASVGVPRWERSLPAGGARRVPVLASAPVAVYLPACVGTMFGPEPGSPGVRAAFLALCDHAGVAVRVPEEIATMCCGTPFASKGLRRAHEDLAARMAPMLWRLTESGRLPIVSDAASCTEGLRSTVERVAREFGSAPDVVDVVAFTRSVVVPALPLLPAARRARSVTVHPTCSTTRLGLTEDLLALAALIADEVTVPVDWACCGFAGDRGLLHPELTRSATAVQAGQVRAAASEVHVSANRTCEIGMTRATGQTYIHVLEQLAVAYGLAGPAVRSSSPDKERNT